MNTTRKPTYAFWLGILTALAAALLTSMTPVLAQADVTETEEHEFTLADGGRFSLSNVNGSIDADDFGLAAERGFVGRDLEGRIGSGEARINLETVNGSIEITKNH